MRICSSFAPCQPPKSQRHICKCYFLTAPERQNIFWFTWCGVGAFFLLSLVFSSPARDWEKFKKVIIVGVLAAVAFIKKLFGRKQRPTVSVFMNNSNKVIALLAIWTLIALAAAGGPAAAPMKTRAWISQDPARPGGQTSGRVQAG